jgi:hypothetical protein
VSPRQHDVLVRKSQDEDFAFHSGNPLRFKVHHRNHLAADQLLRRVVHRELRTRGLDAQVGAEVDGEDVGGLAGLGVWHRGEDPADANVDALEIFPGDGHGGNGKW